MIWAIMIWAIMIWGHHDMGHHDMGHHDMGHHDTEPSWYGACREHLIARDIRHQILKFGGVQTLVQEKGRHARQSFQIAREQIWEVVLFDDPMVVSIGGTWSVGGKTFELKFEKILNQFLICLGRILRILNLWWPGFTANCTFASHTGPDFQIFTVLDFRTGPE